MCKGLVVDMWHLGEQKGVLKSWSRETGREFLNDLEEASEGASGFSSLCCESGSRGIKG